MFTQTIFSNAKLSTKLKESKNKQKTLTLSRGISYELTYSFFDRHKSQNEIKKNALPKIDQNKISELAAIILCRTQLRRGQIESALELLEKFIEKHGETNLILDEKSKILQTLGR